MQWALKGVTRTPYLSTRQVGCTQHPRAYAFVTPAAVRIARRTRERCSAAARAVGAASMSAETTTECSGTGATQRDSAAPCSPSTAHLEGGERARVSESRECVAKARVAKARVAKARVAKAR
eukprot:1025861-Prorocentrum_minimum.AAC.1